MALRILGRNYPDFIPPDFVEDFKTYLARINPSREEDAMVDYRDHRRTTPAGALIEISRLKKSGELNDQQLLLLDNLESHIRKNFQL